MRTTTFLFFISISIFGFTQTVTYDDVAIIVNTNSSESIAIGNYFKQARNIPNSNIISVDAPLKETIDSTEFEFVRAQIESHLINNNMVDDINYLVTTKDIPLAIDFAPSSTTVLTTRSFDSEITMLLGVLASEIGQLSVVNNQTYDAMGNFTRSNTGIYLVTRLDGYTSQDVFDLIDRSGPNTIINPVTAQAILDYYGPSADGSYFEQNYLTPVNNHFLSNNWNVYLDNDTIILSAQSDVFSYTGTVLVADPNTDLNYTWTNGSVASLTSGYSAFTFDLDSNFNDYLILADLISEGCTGGHGYVDFTFYSLLFDSPKFIERYFNSNLNFNLAESFYSGEVRLSSQFVIIGDPKASVVMDEVAAIEGPDAEQFKVYPNPSNGHFSIQLSDLASQVSWTITDASGRVIRQETAFNKDQLEIILDESSGIYLLNLTVNGHALAPKRLIFK
ncbi:MAG: TIGR03790 family protein [Fluviicola sp.]